MSDELSNPNAPGPQTGADGLAQASPPVPQQAGADQFAGLQKRIDELTYRAHEAERRETAKVQELMQQNQQLLMSLATRSQPVEQAQPQLDIDPERRKEIEALMAPQLQALKAQQTQFLAQSMNQQMDGLVGQEHPEVQARARAIWNDAVAKGAHAQGFTPVAALNYARGELFPKLLAAAQQGKQVAAAQNWNAQPQVLQAQSAVPPSASVGQQAQAPDMDEDPEAASAFYAQRLGGKTF